MTTIYVQFKKHISLSKNKDIPLSQIANVAPSNHVAHSIGQMIIFDQQTLPKNEVVVDGLFIIQRIQKHFPNINIRFIGETYTVAYIQSSKNRTTKYLVPIIWLLLFIGTAMTIMNFHHDVGMQEVQQKLHYIFTGKENDYPLWLQIPYSFGLGIGMILFFNYWFTKRFNKEPSPLEVELFKYEQELEQYKHHETIKNDDKFN